MPLPSQAYGFGLVRDAISRGATVVRRDAGGVSTRQVRVSKFLALVLRHHPARGLDVDLGLVPVEPPAVLYHGTTRAALAAVVAEGLRPMERHHVHLSGDRDTAVAVGRRHGAPFVLVVDSGAMHADGHHFFRSVNGVWLTGHVPSRYLSPVE